jgi:uncharacterized protein YidB (DUF937 family)
MNAQDLLAIGAKMFQGQLDKNHDGKMDTLEIVGALSGLFGGGQGKGADPLGGLGNLVSGMQKGGNGDLADLAASWLSTGANKAPSSQHIGQILGQDKIAAFAKQLGIPPELAVKGLQAALPEVVDKASPAGSLDLEKLLGSVGGVAGALNMASKIFGR